MKKKNYLLWSAFAFLTFMNLWEIYCALTGKATSFIVDRIWQASYVVFFISVLFTLYQNKQKQK